MTEDEELKTKEMYEKYANNASEKDITKIAKNLDKMKKGPIAKIWDSVSALWQMIKDPDAAWGAKALAIGALVYLVSPIDAIPDVIPFLGLTDDAGIITAAVTSLATALNKYKKNDVAQIDYKEDEVEEDED